MTKNRWTVAVIIATLAIVASVALIFIERRPESSDCDTVRAMLDYNTAHNSEMAANPDSTTQQEAGIDQYQEWASRIELYSENIADPEIAVHTQRFADLAKQTVTLARKARDETQHSTDRGTPSWVQDYAAIESKSRAEIGALDAKCPA